MEQQLLTALQVALYVVSVAIIVLIAVLTVVLLHFRRQFERVVRTVEELKEEVSPLAQETRVVVERLNDLSGRVQGRWLGVETIIDTARGWSQRANHLVEEIASVVEPPILAASRNIHILRKGLETFVRVLSNRMQHQESEGVVKKTNNGNGNFTGFVVGTCLGAAVGAGVALLVAPRTGKKARRWLASNTREIKDTATIAFGQAKESVRRERKRIAGQEAKKVAGVHNLAR